ncbi:hypothetical protein [Cryobacterium ruanii]|uniref:Uncharacterized protein n=1 Tax=Cryobacterium ruanii TaxID=1259197 RepID=A0A4R9AJX9_9MICO|nr:hypothetical protein [Cryobacterium ruanii]TFD63003.1 hypothetical protein E3T47_15110 [Cryobacterium ruanii]
MGPQPEVYRARAKRVFRARAHQDERDERNGAVVVAHVERGLRLGERDGHNGAVEHDGELGERHDGVQAAASVQK